MSAKRISWSARRVVANLEHVAGKTCREKFAGALSTLAAT
jgi:hypothetical protein